MSDRLKGLFGGGSSDDEETKTEVGSKRKALDEFSRKVVDLDGDGIPDEEVKANFQTVVREASPEQLQRAAAATIQNLPEAKRSELAQMLKDRQQGQNLVDIQRTGELTNAGATGGGGGGSNQGGGDPLTDLLGGLLGGAQGGGGGGGGLGDILGGLLGGAQSGGGGGGLDDILGGLLGGSQGQQPSANSGATAQAPGGGLFDAFGDILSSPVGKALMAGIAAYAAKEMLDKD